MLRVVEFEGAALLKCPACGTHYYYAVDSTEPDTCRPPSCDVTVRRYGPVAALQFLERAAAGRPPPMTVGQFSDAFLGGGDAAPSTAEEAARRKTVERAEQELVDLRARYDERVAALPKLLHQQRLPRWWAVSHALEAVCDHLAVREGWEGLSAGLLAHPDVRVRLAAEAYVARIGLRNLAPFDWLHTPMQVRACLEAELGKPSRQEELAALLRPIEQAPKGKAWRYVEPRFHPADTRVLAREALEQLAKGQRPE